MHAVTGDLFPFAGGVALSPLPLVAVILMLASQNGQRNAVSFVGGWFLGTSCLTIVVTIAVQHLPAQFDHNTGTIAASLKLVFGILLLLIAW